jgi:hypothetical protein
MKHLKYTFIACITIMMLSCSKPLYVNSYEPLDVFLTAQNIHKKQKIILQRDKVSNAQALRLFNGGEGIEHIIDPIDKIDYTGGLFEKKLWKKMYKTYINDTIPKYWKKEDFPEHNFILENKKGLLAYDFLIRYMNSGIEDVILLSEPMLYMKKKYVVFYYNKLSFFGSTKPQVVIMTKEDGKWVVVRIIGDYIYY